MSFEVKPEWVDKGLDAAAKEAEKVLAGDELAAALAGIEDLRAVREPMARLSQPVVRTAIEVFHESGSLQACRDAFDLGRRMDFEERRRLKAEANEAGRAARDQHDRDINAFLAALGKVALKALPFLLAAL